MEKFLLKLARQLNSLDEASLMSLWDKYGSMVQRFEPSKRWEEYALVFSLIQSVRWKNQLFNFRWSTGLAQNYEKDHHEGSHAPVPALEDLPSDDGDSGLKPPLRSRLKPGAKVLAFRAPKDDQSS